jgi:hypothetical protein
MTLSSAIMLSVITLSVMLFYYYAECHYAECHYAECRGVVTSTLAHYLWARIGTKPSEVPYRNVL